MQINCPNCQTSYDINRASLGPEGRKVRCIRCERVWFVAPPGLELMKAAEAIGLAAAAAAEADPPAESALKSGPAASAEAEHAARAETEEPVADPPAEKSGDDDGDVPPTAPADPDPGAAAAAPTAAGDSDPVVIPQAPSIIPPDHQYPPLPTATAPLESFDHRDIRTRVSRRARKILTHAPRRPGVTGQVGLILALVATIAGLFIWRKDVVRLAPQTASLYAFLGMPVNLRGLTFRNIKTLREMHDGTPVLVVEGEILSTGSRTVEVPRLQFAVRNASGQEVYSWTALAGRSILAPGDSMEFRSRLASPPNDGSDVVVRFHNRRDIVANIR